MHSRSAQEYVVGGGARAYGAQRATTYPKGTQMKTTKKTASVIAVLAAGALASAAPAAASEYAPFSEGPQAAHEDGSKDRSQSIVLRRDGDRSTPFVAEVGSATAAPAAAAGDGFDWGDAAIGAGTSLLAVALVASGAGALGGRRRQSPGSTRAASQEA
jgi:hypothetical protein